MHHPMLSGAIVAGSLLFFTTVRADEPTNARPNLSGVWRLDVDASDDPQKKMREATGSARGMGGGGRGGRGRRGGMPGERMPSSGPSGDAVRELTIRHEDPKLTIVYLDETERVLYTDGRRMQEESLWEDPKRVTGRWEDRKLVVETKSGDREMSEIFELEPSGETLYVTTNRKGRQGREIKFRLVYRLQLTAPVSR